MNRFYIKLKLLTVFENQLKANEKQNKCKILKKFVINILK